MKNFGVSLSSAYDKLDKWEKNDIIIKKKKDKISPGGVQFDIILTEKTKNFLKHLIRDLVINDIIPDYITDIEKDLTPEQFKKLKEKLSVLIKNNDNLMNH